VYRLEAPDRLINSKKKQDAQTKTPARTQAGVLMH